MGQSMELEKGSNPTRPHAQEPNPAMTHLLWTAALGLGLAWAAQTALLLLSYRATARAEGRRKDGASPPREGSAARR